MNNFLRLAIDFFQKLAYIIIKMNEKKKPTYRNYSIQYADGGWSGGKYRNEEHAREVAHLISPSREIAKVEQRNLFSPEVEEELRKEKDEWRCR